MAIKDLLAPKQEQVLRSYLNDNWKTLILSGAVRSGKTYIDNLLFLMELRRISRLAKKLNKPNPMYILAGFSADTIYKNVIAEITTTFGLNIKFDRSGHFRLFGVEVVKAYTGSERGRDSIRGMTAWGAYINEASLAKASVFSEIQKRCSAPEARIICDTNPDEPTHWLKKNYIDNTDPKAGIKTFFFTFDDNPALDDDYKEKLKASTPSGVFYDRDILGLWCTGEGVVYRDFDQSTMTIDKDKLPTDLTYYVGVDWGYEHTGTLIVFADDSQGNTYLIEEHAHKHRFIDYWVGLAHDVQKKYGSTIPFWCDSARPDNLNEFLTHGIRAYNANKAINAGIEAVGSLMKAKRFFVVKNSVDNWLNEVYQYIWNEKTGEPVKENDDSMDAMRYAIYNQHNKAKVNLQRNTLF